MFLLFVFYLCKNVFFHHKKVSKWCEILKFHFVTALNTLHQKKWSVQVWLSPGGFWIIMIFWIVLSTSEKNGIILPVAGKMFISWDVHLPSFTPNFSLEHGFILSTLDRRWRNFSNDYLVELTFSIFDLFSILEDLYKN